MALNFFDTSALAKRYVPEVGSSWVKGLVSSDAFAISELVVVEMASILARRARVGSMTQKEAEETFAVFRLDLDQCTVLDLDRFVVRHASELLLRQTRPA